MKITPTGKAATFALNAAAGGVSVSDPGGVFGGDPITLQQVLDLIAAGGLAGYLTVIRGGQGTTQDLGTLGATATVDLANANYFFGTLAEDCTLSTTGWTPDKDSQITVEITEDGTGGWTPTFDGVTFIGGTPTWDTTLDTVTVVILFSRDGGTTIYGVVVGSGGSSFALTIEDEGTPLATAADTLDFVGGGVTASGTGATKTITIPGVSGGPGDPGADVVLVTAGFGSVTIPGFEGSPDQVPASPDAADDEFEALSGWTTLGTLDVSNVTDFPSHWHGKRTTAGVEVNGLYKAIPGGGMPFTVTMKISSANLSSTGYPSVGLMLLDSTPTAIRTFDLDQAAGGYYVSMRRYSNRTTFVSAVDTTLSGLVTFAGVLSMYMKLLVTSASSVSVSLSIDGFLYSPVGSLTAISPTITPAYVGIQVSDPIGSSAPSPEVVVDWIRFS